MVRKDVTYQNIKDNLDSESNEPNQNLTSCIYPSSVTSNVLYKCIITDLTNPQNTGKRFVISLPSSYTVENLIQEAAKYFLYDPFSFNLMWNANDEMSNLSEVQTISLGDLNLNTDIKNKFEIHEKEGPPKRLKVQDFEYNNTSNSQNTFGMDEEEWKPTNISENIRRNAVYSPVTNLEYGPVNLNNNTMPSISPSFTYDDEVTGYVGLINQAMTCYLNSLLQTLYMTPEFRNGIYRWYYNQVSNDQDDPKKSIPFQLQRLFLNLQTSNKKSIQTHDLTKSFGWNSDDAFQQHDVQELCRVMFDALEKKFKKTKQENLINELYQGKIKDYVKCLECNTESARVDVFLDVPLCIRPFGSDTTFESVEAALDAFVQPEILDDNNKYFCETCKRKCKAHKGLKFESFPYIISLQLKRFDFDYKTMSRFKIGSTVSFPEILNVKKYLQNKNNNDDKETDLQELEKEQENTYENNHETELIENDINNKESINQDEKNQDSLYDYELFSIMIHSGSATGGHYYAYIKSFETNQWYNFNDERVSKIDKSDIIKAFGTSYSFYSSATAYMLQYRQINPKRNEKFIKVEDFDDHLKNLLIKEKNEQLEAERLKEYMENMCKIKVIVPAMPSIDSINSSSSNSTTSSACSSTSSSSLSSSSLPLINKSNSIDSDQNSDYHKNSNITNNLNENNNNNNNLDNLSTKKLNEINFNEFTKKIEKSIDIHRDLTMEQAKAQIIQDLNLANYLNATNQKCRILKYDSYNDMIEQSYRNEEQLTVFEALNFSKYPYNISWFVEILPENQDFVVYNSSDISVKVFNLDMNSFETNELFTIRLNSESTVCELRDQIGKNLNVNPENVRMALEKLHTYYNYLYLNKNLNETLKSQSSTKVNKLFIEYQDENDLSKTFESSKFYYALDTIMNMFQTTVYLPVDEQCEIFMRKTKRHNEYMENQRKSIESQVSTAINDETTIDSFDTVASEQTLSSIVTDSTTTDHQSNISDFNHQTSPRSSNKIDLNRKISTIHNEEQNDDSMSKMSYQETNKVTESLNIIENHFKHDQYCEDDFKQKQDNRGFLIDMETSLDEGIGGSSGSLSTNNPNLKSSPSDLNWFEIKTRPLDVNMGLSNIKDDEETNLGNDIGVDRSTYDDVADLDVNIDDNEINNLDDDLENDNLVTDNPHENIDEDEEFNNNNLDFNTETCPFTGDNSIALSNKNNISKEFKIKTNRVTFSKTQNDDENREINDDLNSKIASNLDYFKYSEENTNNYSISEEKNNFYSRFAADYDENEENKNDRDLDQLPKYSDLEKDKFKRTTSEDDYFKLNKNNDRYIKSSLNVNQELVTRTLEIKMDKRIELNEFKSHVDECLNIGIENFRVLRMGPNESEYELTSPENQFLYLPQNTKFLIKLGPPLKYGEYVLPVYELNKTKGSFKYLCDFMIFHNLTVLNHKELLKEDLKDECNLDIPVEKMRLRKKISKRPGNIMLDTEVFGMDIFVNSTSELCIEILDEPETKKSKNQTSVYLRKWKPDEYELGDLEEVIIDGNTFELLISHISLKSGILTENIEILRCLRDFPFKSPILDLHKNLAWKENFYMPMEKLEDGCCFYYRNKTLRLGTISDEKRREIEKEDNINFRSTGSSILSNRKEIGIKIHVENS